MIEVIKRKYTKLINSSDPMEHIWDFKSALLSSDTDDVLEFHYQIIQDQNLDRNIKGKIRRFFHSDIENKRDKNKVSKFLYQKYQSETDILLKAEIIQTLGHLRSSYGKQIALKEIKSPIRDVRYRCIIVLGWVGDETDLKTLNERLKNDPDPELREYAATAMRQIWYKDEENKSIIDQTTHYIHQAIVDEQEEEALIGIIITLQDLHKKKLGIKESDYGDTSGNVDKAKKKAIKFLKNYFGC